MTKELTIYKSEKDTIDYESNRPSFQELADLTCNSDGKYYERHYNPAYSPTLQEILGLGYLF